jgi:hypothetical protein
VTEYRIQKTIDVVVSDDEDGNFLADEIIGSISYYPTVSDLEASGFTVTKIATPAEEPAGTVRKFPFSGDLIVKGDDGQWRYVTSRYPSNALGDVLHGFPDGHADTVKIVST